MKCFINFTPFDPVPLPERKEVEKAGIHPDFDSPALQKWLVKVPTLIGDEAESPFQLQLPGGNSVVVAYNITPAEPGRAKKAFEHGSYLLEHRVFIPHPIAWFESTQPGKEIQVVISEMVPETCTFKAALLHHYLKSPLCSEIMNLLQVVADAVKSMHEAGFLHGCLTNDFISVVRNEKGEWEKAWVTQLQYGQILPELSAKQRGADNGKLTLPSDLRRVFFEMQAAPECWPQAFHDAEQKTRNAYSKLTNPSQKPEYPCEKDIWIWDDRSRQAIPALKSRDKRAYYRKRDLCEMVAVNLKFWRAIKKASKEMKQQAWSVPVQMSKRIGLSCNLEPDRFEKERKWLDVLGPLPLLVRLYHHESEANQRYAIDAVRKLRAEGHSLQVALVQDRRAVTHPGSWQTFVDRAGDGLSGFVEGFEIGHAINRVKWGIWNLPEYETLISPFREWEHRYPQIPLMGPAGIDFEYPRVLPFLDKWKPASLSALSHHLYVDRRGDPENKQNGVNTLGKLALARAIARVHPSTQEKLIISEVNWPLKGTGVYSPVGSPYQSPGERKNDPSVDEETYARYMKKYILLALCSGLADQVYWWNLAAHGFGLIDDRDPNGWRPRPAFFEFKSLINLFEGATFTEREGKPFDWVYKFKKADQEFEI